MRATLIYRDGERAAVRLEPSWLALMFGARAYVVELERTSSVHGHWRGAGSGRNLDTMPRAGLIKNALDRPPLGELPEARVVSR